METLLFITYLLLSCFKFSSAVDSITQSQNLTDGKTLVSTGRVFELGFFSPGISKSRYLGIMYHNISDPTVVWVANRFSPINGSSGMLTMSNRASVLVLGENKNVVWSGNSSKQVQNPILQLLDTGNLVLKDQNSDEYLWQSFDYPTDTLLPGMKLGWDFRKGLNRRLSAWKDPNDPSPGSLTFSMENNSYPEPVMWNGTREFMRTGPWNGLQYSAKPTTSLPILVYHPMQNKDEVYYSYTLMNNSLLGRMVLNQSLNRREVYLWSASEKIWTLYATMPRDYCDSYGVCGPYGNCDVQTLSGCQCLKGFKPKVHESWRSMNYAEGCVRNKPLNCNDKFGFLKYPEMKLPDTKYTWVNESMNLEECREKCLSDCNCTAYSNTDVKGTGSGCAIWFGDLMDAKEIHGGGQDLYIKLHASELESKKNKSVIIIAPIVAAAVLAGLLIVAFFIIRNQKKRKENKKTDQDIEGKNDDRDLPLFDLSTLANATDNFSFSNKLGEGGFGSVYKGQLENGQEIVVKRLSSSSPQGLNEFKNEVILIAKLQHRNLVKLFGCCIQGKQKMLVYEYLPNKSLDSFLFDQDRKKLLDWPKRFNIICGTARGLLYLHQESRLRIIHRNLKASNVLLDINMNPKISDFGNLRTFAGDQTKGNTKTVIGTYGYMAPEYAIDGQYSIKSDVFSFGILMLEIISGERNKGIYRSQRNLNLIGHVWKLWNEGRPLELIDPAIGESYSVPELLRCIHISLLCIQQRPEDRPTMSTVIVMLSNETSALPQPKEPGFVSEKDAPSQAQFMSEKNEPSSINGLTISQLEPR